MGALLEWSMVSRVERSFLDMDRVMESQGGRGYTTRGAAAKEAAGKYVVKPNPWRKEAVSNGHFTTIKWVRTADDEAKTLLKKRESELKEELELQRTRDVLKRKQLAAKQAASSHKKFHEKARLRREKEEKAKLAAAANAPTSSPAKADAAAGGGDTVGGSVLGKRKADDVVESDVNNVENEGGAASPVEDTSKKAKVDCTADVNAAAGSNASDK
eukprot:GFYU01007595.1.p1 GENE.GFYU01007595.1~~GFYU01007595.1.p1  ORF type:complete len:215 (-),score=55.28 GFYU01007595.1:219-863(-)